VSWCLSVILAGTTASSQPGTIFPSNIVDCKDWMLLLLQFARFKHNTIFLVFYNNLIIYIIIVFVFLARMLLFNCL